MIEGPLTEAQTLRVAAAMDEAQRDAKRYPHTYPTLRDAVEDQRKHARRFVSYAVLASHECAVDAAWKAEGVSREYCKLIGYKSGE